MYASPSATPSAPSFLAEHGTAGPITTTHADVWDEATVGPALAGSDAVVNTVGHYVERGRRFEAIHGQGAMHVAHASAMAEVRRWSTSRASAPIPGSASPYVRARATGERLVKEAFPERPSSVQA